MEIVLFKTHTWCGDSMTLHKFLPAAEQLVFIPKHGKTIYKVQNMPTR